MANGDRPLVDPTATSSLIVDDLGRQTCILSYRLDEKDPYIRKQQEVY
jgi:hypothetical protein